MSTDPDTPKLDLVRALRIQAHANRLANRRLQAALGNLSTAELHAPRTSFFPTIIGTLNHLLAVDRFYIAALHGDPDAKWTLLSSGTNSASSAQARISRGPATSERRAARFTGPPM